LKEDAHVTLVVYNLLGQKVRTLVDEYQPAAFREVIWDGKTDSGNEASSGIYLYKLKAGDFVKSEKMTILK